MEEQILHYYLKAIKKILLTFLILILLYFVYFFQFKTINNNDELLLIKKNQNLKFISFNILEKSTIVEQYLYYIFLIFWNKYIDNIHYGEFKFENNLNLIEKTKIISNSSNVFYNFALIDGWEEYQLNLLIKKKFNKDIFIDYEEILADTYVYNSSDDFNKVYELMKKNKIRYFEKNKNNKLFNTYSVKEIMIIASLVEKEAKDDQDKKFIASVIFNRLKKGMKLQIDASTIFSITKGKFKYDKKLTYSDLKIKNEYNTYFNDGLPPKPICYISGKTIDFVLKDYKTTYLFYFYDEKLKQHIYSNTFKEHKEKLNIYRSNEQ